MAGYGSHTILNEATIEVYSGEIVALVGHNGAGKSTLLKCIFGMIPIAAGSIEVHDTEIRTPAPPAMISLGVALAQQGNRVLPDLTVEEHLRLAAMAIRERARRKRAVTEAFLQFDVLNERRKQKAGTLSGGEKQILVLAASLVSSPEILLLDEPTLGLAPTTRAQILRTIAGLRDERRMSMLIAEQRVQEILAIADRVCVMRRGVISFESTADHVRRNPEALTKAFF